MFKNPRCYQQPNFIIINAVCQFGHRPINLLLKFSTVHKVALNIAFVLLSPLQVLNYHIGNCRHYQWFLFAINRNGQALHVSKEAPNRWALYFYSRFKFTQGFVYVGNNHCTFVNKYRSTRFPVSSFQTLVQIVQLPPPCSTNRLRMLTHFIWVHPFLHSKPSLTKPLFLFAGQFS